MRMPVQRLKISARLYLMVALAVTLPYIIGTSPNPADSSSTSIEVAFGKGSYSHVSRDCNGNVLGVTDYPYTDGGIAIDHDLSSARIGLKAGFYNVGQGVNSSSSDLYGYDVPSEARTTYYANPNVGYHEDWLGLDCGIGLFSNDILETGHSYSGDGVRVLPSVRLRLGYPDGFHFSTGFADNMPIVSGGGLLDLGCGFPLGPPGSDLWLGLGVLPYDGFGLNAKGDFPISSAFAIRPGAHIRWGDATEYGLSLGGKIYF